MDKIISLQTKLSFKIEQMYECYFEKYYNLTPTKLGESRSSKFVQNCLYNSLKISGTEHWVALQRKANVFISNPYT